MAMQFAQPVTDDAEVQLRATAIPENTTATTEWGMRIWNEQATQ